MSEEMTAAQMQAALLDHEREISQLRVDVVRLEEAVRSLCANERLITENVNIVHKAVTGNVAELLEQLSDRMDRQAAAIAGIDQRTVKAN